MVETFQSHGLLEQHLIVALKSPRRNGLESPQEKRETFFHSLRHVMPIIESCLIGLDSCTGHIILILIEAVSHAFL